MESPPFPHFSRASLKRPRAYRYAGIMPRPKSPNGRCVPMSLRFSEPEAAEIDAARGPVDRSAWMRSACLIVARGEESGPSRRVSERPGRAYQYTGTPERVYAPDESYSEPFEDSA